jgi:hypothetical protein
MQEKIKIQKGFIQIPIIAIIASAIVVSGIVYGAVEYNKTSKLIKEAEKLSKEEKYNEAINKLELLQKRLSGKVLNQKINNELERNKKLLEDKSEYAKGMEEFNKGNWEKAKELLSKVSEISPYYQDAKSKIEEAQNKMMNEKISEAVNKAKTEIQNQQTKQLIENPPLLQNNSTEQSNENEYYITKEDIANFIEIDTIYDRYGKPQLRLLGNGRLVDFNGKSIGFLQDNNLYNYDGKHVGWYEGGIMRDHQGYYVGFGERVTDYIHLLLPLKQLKPLATIPEIEPSRPILEIPPLHPLNFLRWSEINPIDLFFINQQF